MKLALNVCTYVFLIILSGCDVETNTLLTENLLLNGTKTLSRFDQSPIAKTLTRDLVIDSTPMFSDTFYVDQLHFYDYHPGNNVAGSSIERALSKTESNKEIRVAVLDAAFKRHPDISYNSTEAITVVPSIYGVYNEIGERQYSELVYDWVFQEDAPIDAEWQYIHGNPNEWCGSDHGTAMISQLSSVTDNSLGLASGNGFDVIPIRISDCSFDHRITSGIYAALGLVAPGQDHPTLAEPVDIISISIVSYSGCSQELQDAVSLAESMGVLIVAGAGNHGSNMMGSTETGYVYAPASCDDVLSVGAVNRYGEVASFSNYNADVAVIGVDVPAAINSDGEYGLVNGTSPATQIASLISGLAWQKHPEATPAHIREGIKASSNPYFIGDESTTRCNEDNSVCTYEGNACAGMECFSGIADASNLIDYLDSLYTPAVLSLIKPLGNSYRQDFYAALNAFKEKVDVCSATEIVWPETHTNNNTFVNLFTIDDSLPLLVSNATFLEETHEQRQLLPNLAPGNQYAYQVCSNETGCIDEQVQLLDLSLEYVEGCGL